MIIIAVVFVATLLIGVPIALVLGLSGMTHMLIMSPAMWIVCATWPVFSSVE